MIRAILIIITVLTLLTPTMAEQQGWWNFESGRMEMRQTAPATDEEARRYIPQDAATQMIYLLERCRGATVVEAMICALKDAVNNGRMKGQALKESLDGVDYMSPFDCQQGKGGLVMKDEYCYVAIHSDCGGWQAVRVICPETEKDMARQLKSWRKAGLEPRIIPLRDFRANKIEICPCLKKKRKEINEKP